MQIGKSWVCRHCNNSQVLTSGNFGQIEDNRAMRASDYPVIHISASFATCAFDECRKLTFHLTVISRPSGEIYKTLSRRTFQLIPSGSIKTWPDYIPSVIISDYREANLIKVLSPKASATLARRCIQGMIRDFCGISCERLIDEIRQLRTALLENRAPREVKIETLDAIDAIRSIGNIGAHMEKDINVIVDVDEDEAELLISIIEMLFEDWYISRHQYQERLARLSHVAESKKQAKHQGGG